MAAQRVGYGRSGFFQETGAHQRRQLAAANIQTIVELAELPDLDYDPLVSFVAMAYFDRCYSRHPIEDNRVFAMFTISCITLAWKRTANVFPTGQLLEAFSHGIEVEEVTAMELRILSDLNWQMRLVTALSFLDFFLDLMNVHDPEERQTLKTESTEYVFYMHYETEFTVFKPSVIAAAGLLAETAGYGPIGYFLEFVLGCDYVNTDELEDCLNLLKIRKALVIDTAIPESDDEDDDDDEDHEETLRSLILRMRKRKGKKVKRRIGGRRNTGIPEIEDEEEEEEEEGRKRGGRRLWGGRGRRGGRVRREGGGRRGGGRVGERRGGRVRRGGGGGRRGGGRVGGRGGRKAR